MKKIVFFSLFILIGHVAMANDGSEDVAATVAGVDAADTLPEPPGPTIPPGLPIDGGILAGVVVALAFGTKKVLSHKKN
ncbi:hypothetical protein [Pseudotamlana haliotis]|nr:hypothetical protein [Tamlana haliotis]